MGIELKINYPPYYPPRNLRKSSEFYTLDRCRSAAFILALPAVPLLHWQAEGRMGSDGSCYNVIPYRVSAESANL